jgi:hypothetical protein
MNRCAYIKIKINKTKLQWNSCSNNSKSTWWWPNVAETCSTRVKTDVLKVALKAVILNVKVFIHVHTYTTFNIQQTFLTHVSIEHWCYSLLLSHYFRLSLKQAFIKYCNVLVTRHKVWIDNWIYWTLITSYYKSLQQPHWFTLYRLLQLQHM